MKLQEKFRKRKIFFCCQTLPFNRTGVEKDTLNRAFFPEEKIFVNQEELEYFAQVVAYNGMSGIINLHMNRFLTSSTLILLICCSDQITNAGWTKPALEGQWKFVTATLVENTPFLSQYPDPKIFADEAPLPKPPYIAPDLIFEKDTMYELKYPESIRHRIKFSLDSGYLVSRSIANRAPCPLEFTNDTLCIYKPYSGGCRTKRT